MKSYLMNVIIHDGEHEHRDEALVHAKSQEEAERIARKCLTSYGNEGEGVGYFDYGDGTTEAVLKSVVPITRSEADALRRLNVCYYIN